MARAYSSLAPAEDDPENSRHGGPFRTRVVGHSYRGARSRKGLHPGGKCSNRANQPDPAEPSCGRGATGKRSFPALLGWRGPVRGQFLQGCSESRGTPGTVNGLGRKRCPAAVARRAVLPGPGSPSRLLGTFPGRRTSVKRTGSTDAGPAIDRGFEEAANRDVARPGIAGPQVAIDAAGASGISETDRSSRLRQRLREFQVEPGAIIARWQRTASGKNRRRSY